MSGSAINARLLPANTTLLQPGSRFFRLSDAFSYQVAALAASVSPLQSQITDNATSITALQATVTALQAQVAAQQVTINSFSYLQTEVSTGTIFLDQRTIYKRSFVINNALNTALTNVPYPHNIANINYVVNIQAMAALNQQQQYPVTFLNAATAPALSTAISCWADTQYIVVSVGTTTFPNFQVLVTLWYTATDR